MLREAQMQILRWALAIDAGDEPVSPDSVNHLDTNAWWASGLTAYAAWLVEQHHIRLPPPTEQYLRAQRAEVAARTERFAAIAPQVLDALRAREVDAIPVKGLLLSERVWPINDLRPMADLDFIIDRERRASAYAAMQGAGWNCTEQNDHEDTYVVWPAGEGADEATGESVLYQGKVELHPGWNESCHGYSIGNTAALLTRAERTTLFGARCLALDPVGQCAHTLGHLSAAVIRREVRPIHVVDALLSLRSLDRADRVQLADFLSQLDPRLSAPALWIVRATDRDTKVVSPIATGQIRRLSEHQQKMLAATLPSRVLRDPAATFPLQWRFGWAATMQERAAVMRQFTFPTRHEMGGAATTESIGVLWKQRARRVARRITHDR